MAYTVSLTTKVVNRLTQLKLFDVEQIIDEINSRLLDPEEQLSLSIERIIDRTQMYRAREAKAFFDLHTGLALSIPIEQSLYGFSLVDAITGADSDVRIGRIDVHTGYLETRHQRAYCELVSMRINRPVVLRDSLIPNSKISMLKTDYCKLTQIERKDTEYFLGLIPRTSDLNSIVPTDWFTKNHTPIFNQQRNNPEAKDDMIQLIEKVRDKYL